MYESWQNIRQNSILISMENIYLPLKRVQVVLSVQCSVRTFIHLMASIRFYRISHSAYFFDYTERVSVVQTLTFCRIDQIIICVERNQYDYDSKYCQEL